MINLLSMVTSITLVLWALYLAVLVLLFIVSAIEGPSTITNLEWPIIFSDHLLHTFSDNNTETFARPHDSDFGGLVQLHATLSPRDMLWPYFEYYKQGAVILKYSLYIGVVWFLHHILLDINYQIPFSQNNIRRLKYIALLLFFSVPFAMLDTWIVHGYIMQHIEMNDIEFISSLFTSDDHAQKFLQPHQVLLSNQRDWSPVGYAALVYVLALVFQEGLKLKQDNESIV